MVYQRAQQRGLAAPPVAQQLNPWMLSVNPFIQLVQFPDNVGQFIEAGQQRTHPGQLTCERASDIDNPSLLLSLSRKRSPVSLRRHDIAERHRRSVGRSAKVEVNAEMG